MRNTTFQCTRRQREICFRNLYIGVLFKDAVNCWFCKLLRYTSECLRNIDGLRRIGENWSFFLTKICPIATLSFTSPTWTGWNWTQTYAVRGQQLAARAVAQPQFCKSNAEQKGCANVYEIMARSCLYYRKPLQIGDPRKYESFYRIPPPSEGCTWLFQILWQRSAMISHSVRWCHFPRRCLLFIVLCCSRLNYLRWKWSIRRSCSHCTLANVNCHSIRSSPCSGASAVLWGALMATAPSVHCTSKRKFKPCIVIYPFIQEVLAVGKFLRHKSIKNFSSIWPYTFCI
jgi:hypothetical protein